MGHFVEQGKFMISSSLFKRIPSNFLTKGSNRNKSSGSCCYSRCLILNFVNSFFSYCEQLSHMISPYLIKGLINAMYIVSKDFLSSLNFNFLIMLILAHALTVIWFMC